MSKKIEVPIWCKSNLTIAEAAAYSNIGQNTIERLIQEPCCDFLLMVGKKRLIKRELFDKYISSVSNI